MDSIGDRNRVPQSMNASASPKNVNSDAPLVQREAGKPMLSSSAYAHLPAIPSAPHSANFKNLTPESVEAAERHFKDNTMIPPSQPQGFWGKITAALWGAAYYCAGLAETKLSSGEVQQASKIVSTGRKFQLGISSAFDSQNIFELTQGNKTHLDYTLSVLSSAAGLYKCVTKHNKDDLKSAKAIKSIEAATDKLEAIYEKAESLQEAIDERLQNIERKIARSADPKLLKQYKELLTEKNEIEGQIKALIQNMSECEDAKDMEDMKDTLTVLKEDLSSIQRTIQDIMLPYDSTLDGDSLDTLQSQLQETNKELRQLDHDIKRLLHESWEFSKRECTASALVFASGTKTFVSGVKYAVDYGTDYDLTIRKYGKAIKAYLNTNMMTPVFVAGLGVSLYGTYTLGHNYLDRSRIQAAAQNILSDDMEDPEIEAFASLVASRQRTTQAALSLGSTMAKVVQNSIALGVAFGGIQIASAATGIDESVLELIATPATWCIGGAVACTSIGLKTYQNYKEACRQEEEAYWVQVLLDTRKDGPTTELSDAYMQIAEEMIVAMDEHYAPGTDNLRAYVDEMREEINLAVRNKAILSLMKLNPDFAVGVIYARVNSIDMEVREGTENMLLKLGLDPSDIEEVRELSTHLACNLIKEKLCLL